MSPIIVYKDGLVFTADPNPEKGDVEMYQKKGFVVKPCIKECAKRVIRTLSGYYENTNGYYPAALIPERSTPIQKSILAKYGDCTYPINNGRGRI